MMTRNRNYGKVRRGRIALVLLAALAVIPATAQLSEMRAAMASRGSIQGGITAADTNLPLAKVTVELRALPSTGSNPIRALTDALGKFHLAAIPRGTYVLSARLNGYEPVTYTPVTGLTSFVVKANDTRSIQIRLS